MLNYFIIFLFFFQLPDFDDGGQLKSDGEDLSISSISTKETDGESASGTDEVMNFLFYEFDLLFALLVDKSKSPYSSCQRGTLFLNFLKLFIFSI